MDFYSCVYGLHFNQELSCFRAQAAMGAGMINPLALMMQQQMLGYALISGVFFILC